MEQTSIPVDVPNLALSPAYNNCIAALHFRFLCKTAKIEQSFMDSINRAWLELRSFFPDLPIMMDNSNCYHLGLYPFSMNPQSEVVHWERWEPELYSDGELFCGDASAIPDAEKISEPWLKMLYAEQFVCRLSLLWLDETDRREDAEKLLLNLLQNACVEGATLLSLEEVIPEGFSAVDVSKILPDVSSKASSQPISGFLHRDTVLLSPSELGFLSRHRCDAAWSEWDNNAHELAIDFLVEEPELGIVDSRMLQLTHAEGDVRFLSLQLSLSAQKSHYGKSPELIGVVSQGVDWPVWRSVDEGDTMLIQRLVKVPILSHVEDVFYAARGYPICSKFGDRMGTEYLNLMEVSDIKGLLTSLESGAIVERDVLSSGKVVFHIYFPQQQDTPSGLSIVPVHVFTGTEAQAESFLCQLSDIWGKDPYPTMDDAMLLAEQLGCTPELDAHDAAPHRSNQFN